MCHAANFHMHRDNLRIGDIEIYEVTLLLSLVVVGGNLKKSGDSLLIVLWSIHVVVEDMSQMLS